MDVPAKFVELAQAKGNEIKLQTKALENLFENPEVRDTQIAIYSVLGKPSSKTSQHFQDALKYLFEKDGTDLDDTLTKTISEFGNHTEGQKASIVTWSKPFFVTKGSKQVAIFLLGIQGNFKDSYDPTYIMLSGLCSFMSSTIIYLADGKTEEFMKHIGCIAVEGLRHLSKQTSLLHQNMVVVVENWNRTEEVTFGNVSSHTYLEHLKINLKKGLNKTFEAFEEFGFFFLPSSSHEMFSVFHNKLLMNTLGSCYIVPKKRGALVRPQQLMDDVIHYVEEMDPDATFNSSLEQFLNLRQPNHSEGKTKESTNSTEKKAAAKKPTCGKKRKSSSVTDGDNKMPNGECNPTSKSQIKNPAQQRENASGSKIPVPSVGKSSRPVKSNANVNKKTKEEKTNRQTTTPQREDEENLMEENTDPLNQQPLEKVNNENIPRSKLYTVTSEKFDLKKFMGNNAGSVLKKENNDPPAAPLPTAIEILQKTSQSVPKHSVFEQTQPKRISTALVELNVKVSPEEEQMVSAAENHSPSNEVKKDSLRETPLLKSNCLIRRVNDENQEATTGLLSKFSFGATKSITNSPPKSKTAIEVAIIQAFRNTDLQSSSSAETILRKVILNFKPLETDFRKDFERYKDIVNEAISAILIYIEKMESVFETAFNVTPTEFDDLHKQHYEMAMEKVKLSEFLRVSITMKIDEAKRIFQAHNNSNFLEKHSHIESAVEEMRNIYLAKMHSPPLKIDEQDLLKRHKEITKVICQSLDKFCQVYKSTWSDILLETLQTELNKELEKMKKALQKTMNKVDKEMDACLAFYNNEMRRKQNYPLMNQTESFDELHSRTSSEASDRFTRALEKLNENFSDASILPVFNEKLESCCHKLRNEFAAKKRTSPLTAPKKISAPTLTRVENTFFKPNNEIKCQTTPIRPFAAKLEEKLLMPHNREAKNQITLTQQIQESERPNRCIGIDFNVSEIIVSGFKDGAVEEILRRKDPCIGFSEQVVWAEGKSSTTWNLSSTKIYKTVSLDTILEAGVGDPLSLNWGGETKTFLFEELLSLMFSLIKFESEKLIDHEINICAISVPSNINETEVQAIHDAAKISGFLESHVLREICSAIFGCSYFKNMSGTLPKNFIICNSFSENLDAGYYDLSKSWNPAVLSGDTYIHANQPNMLFGKPTLKERFKNVINDITGLVEDTEVTDVLVLANEKTYRELSDRKDLKRWKFHRVQIPAIHNGAAFVAALVGKNSDAEDYWKKNCPSELAGEKKLREFLNRRWVAPLTSQPCVNKRKATNIPGCNISDHQEKLMPLLTKGLSEVVI